MSNSPLVSYTKLSPNHSGQRTHVVDRITPHCVVGQCSVETLGNIFAPTSRQASCQYGIGVDGRVGMYVEEKNRSWCSSSNANDQRAITIECASDATHPYAAEVTRNIRKACEEAEVSYTRILRTGSGQQNAVYVKDTQAAAEYLKGTTGNVLLTTGSKELAAFTSVPDYKERLFARVLSLPSVIESCQALGFEGRNLIAMQGPFAEDLNVAMMKAVHAKWMVTKESGKIGRAHV